MKTMSRICLLTLLLSASCTFTSCDFINEKKKQYFSSPNSNSLVGEWVEASDDDYLVGHYQFYDNGNGRFWLTDGPITRGGFEFTWEQNGMYVKTYTPNSSGKLTLANGVLAQAYGGLVLVYHKK